jgi:four helix bundle protein
MHSQNYSDLIAWQKAMTLAEAVYLASSYMPRDERFGPTAQMRRAVVSIPANIAEGEGRRTDGEFLNQLSVAHGSIRELETHVMLAERLKFLPHDQAAALLLSAGEVGRLVNGLSNSIERRTGKKPRER